MTIVSEIGKFKSFYVIKINLQGCRNCNTNLIAIHRQGVIALSDQIFFPRVKLLLLLIYL